MGFLHRLTLQLHHLATGERLYPLVAFLCARRVVVQGWSMHPTLVPGERVLVDRLAYCGRPPRHGDIVLVRHPQQPELQLLKRVAAAPGDHAPALPDDGYFLLGDQPDHSTDSRNFGPVAARAIIGRAWLVYWPLNRFRRL